MSDIRQRLLAAFQIEQRDHLVKLRAFLDLLEGSHEPEAGDYQDAMRSAHTLKGASRAVGLSGLEHLAHTLESVLEQLKSGGLPGSPAVISVLRRVFDAVEDYAGSPGVLESEPPQEAVQALEQLLQGEVETAPPQDLQRPPPDPEPPASAVPTVRVPAAVLDRLAVTSGELVAEAARTREKGNTLRELAQHLGQVEKNLHDPQLHQCLSLTRMLLSMQARSQSALERLGEALGEQVREARMVPARDLLGDLGSVARDLARSQGKQVDFRARGLEIQVDRRVLEQLREPLLHMIRNAVDHGLEPPAERAAQGKSEVGRLELELRMVRSRLRTTLSDDGRGVSLGQVRQRASALGLEAPESVDGLLRLLFLPEFSTAAEPGKLSGRGLGLSVLEQVAERLQGRALLARRTPCGTMVGLETPLSVTAQSLLMVRCRNQVFGLPTHAVERLVCHPAEDFSSLESRSVLSVDGVPVAVGSLAGQLGADDPSVELDGGRMSLVLLHSAGRRFFLAVDAFLFCSEAVVAPLEVPGYANPRLAGVVLLEDDSVCLVLNPARLVESPRGTLVRAGSERPPPQEEKSGRILVVDDSITTRMLEKSILETHGYRVVVALDGEDALRQLRLHQVDLVISDIQMPRLDGFGLLTAIKADPVLRHLPVVLLTSREDRDDQQRGLDLGAEAYLSKQRFDQESLLETVRQIL